MECIICGKSFETLTLLQGHRKRARPKADGTRKANPCQFSDEELATNRAVALLVKRDRDLVAQRVRRHGGSREAYHARRRLDPAERLIRHRAARIRWAAAHPGRMNELRRAYAKRQRVIVAAAKKDALRRTAERVYQRTWRAANPTYHHDWRIAHREGERARRRRWRLANPEKVRAQRLRETRVSRAAAVVPLPSLFVGHPVMEEALALAGRAWYGSELYDPTNEDAASEAVLAILEGRDPKAAIHAYRRLQWEETFHTTVMPENI